MNSEQATETASGQRLFWFAFIVIAIISVVSDITQFQELQPRFIGHADQANTAVLARNIAEGNGAVVDVIWIHTGGGIPGNALPIPESYWSIYVAGIVAFFFLLFGPGLGAMLAPAALMKIGVAAISAALVLRISRSTLAAFAAAVVLLFHPMMTKVVTGLSDIYLTFFVLSTAVVLAFSIAKNSRSLFFLAGLLIGVAIGVKPSGLLLLGLLLGYIFFNSDLRSTVVNMATAAVGIVAGLLPLAIHNYQGFGSVLSPAHLLVKEAARIRAVTGDHHAGFFDPSPYPVAEGIPFLQYYLKMAGAHLPNFMGALLEGSLVPVLLLPLFLLGVIMVLASIRSWFIYRDVSFEQAFQFIAVQMVIAGLVLACAVHFEARYWNFVIPFLVILSVVAVARLARYRPLPAVLYATMVLGVLWAYTQEVRDYKPQPIPRIYAQAASVLPRDAVVFTNDPWEFAFHAERKSVMLPYTEDDATLLATAERYGVGYIAILGRKTRHHRYQAFVDGELPEYLEVVPTRGRLTLLKFK